MRTRFGRHDLTEQANYRTNAKQDKNKTETQNITEQNRQTNMKQDRNKTKMHQRQQNKRNKTTISSEQQKRKFLATANNTEACNKVQTELRPTNNYIVAQIGPKRKLYNILVDTGAAVSCISIKLVKRDGLRLLDLANDDLRVLNTANNTKLKVLGKVTTIMCINNVNILVTFYVTDTLSSAIILGCDMLKYELMANIDLARDELTLFDGVMSVPLTQSMRQCSVAYLKQDRIIPPLTEVMVKFRVPRKFKTETVLLERTPACEAPGAPRVANSLSRIEDGEVIAKVINPWSSPVTLRRNKHYVTVIEFPTEDIIQEICLDQPTNQLIGWLVG